MRFLAECVPTAIIGGGEVCDNGHGDSVYNMLTLIVNIMSVGIGILAVIGITVVGIQYLTAGGNEEQTRKAKRRIFEIVIGLFMRSYNGSCQHSPKDTQTKLCAVSSSSITHAHPVLLTWKKKFSLKYAI